MKKEITFLGALATVVGSVIGAGVFFKIGAMVAITHSAQMTLLAWVVSAILTIAAGLTLAELAVMFPETGGAVKYLEHTYGSLAGFLFGWTQILIYFPANIAALSIIFATQFVALFHVSESLLIFIAIFAGASVACINAIGAKVSTNFQQVITVLKLLPIAAIIVFGFIQPGDVTVQLFPLEMTKDSNSFIALGGAVLASMFAFDGWLNIGTIAGEMKKPEKDLPKAIILGLSVTAVVYITISYVFLHFLPIDQIAGNENTASMVAQKIFGASGGKIVTIGILVSVYGAINGYTMTAIRVPYALGVQGILPFSKQFAKLNKSGSPFVSILFIFTLAVLMMCLGSFNLLTDLVIFVIWLFSLLLFIGVFLLRKKLPDQPRPYKVIGYPVVPIVAMFGSLFIMVTTLVTQPLLVVLGIGITLLGVPVYFLVQKR